MIKRDVLIDEILLKNMVWRIYAARNAHLEPGSVAASLVARTNNEAHDEDQFRTALLGVTATRAHSMLRLMQPHFHSKTFRDKCFHALGALPRTHRE